MAATAHLRSNKGRKSTPADVVYTPAHVAEAIVQRYHPAGHILDPCEGGGAFSSLMPGCSVCEITRGTDFFDWHDRVDWIVGNPPYSILPAWLEHSFKIADNIVYLIPIAKIFGSRVRLRSVMAFGLVEVWAPWTGRDIGFPFGWAVGAVHLRRGSTGPVSIVS